MLAKLNSAERKDTSIGGRHTYNGCVWSASNPRRSVGSGWSNPLMTDDDDVI